MLMIVSRFPYCLIPSNIVMGFHKDRARGFVDMCSTIRKTKHRLQDILLTQSLRTLLVKSMHAARLPTRRHGGEGLDL